MDRAVTSEAAEYARSIGPEPDEVLREMDAYAEERGFPHVGPEVGAWLRALARIVGAERIFEFGSGFGYSAYWFAGGLAEEGRIVLTEVDADELALAREFLARGGYEGVATFEHGDALEVVDRHEGPFDLVLVDHEKERYPDAFEAIRGKLSPGAVVVADNVMTAGEHVDFAALRRHARGDPVPLEGPTAGIAAYLDRVGGDPAFETVLLPFGSGLSVSTFRPR